MLLKMQRQNCNNREQGVSQTEQTTTILNDAHVHQNPTQLQHLILIKTVTGQHGEENRANP